MAQNLVVTPLPLINGLPGMRMEIRDMRNNDPDCFELLVLALSMMQWDNQTNELSWYQIAGAFLLPGCHIQPLVVSWHSFRPYSCLQGVGMLTRQLPTGIHFLPAQPWAEVMPVEGNERLGYGMHSSILFCNWHRPYVALFEVWRIPELLRSQREC